MKLPVKLLVLLMVLVFTEAIQSPQQNDKEKLQRIVSSELKLKSFFPVPISASKPNNVLNDPQRKFCYWTNNGYGNFFLDGDSAVLYYLSDWEGLWNSDDEEGNTLYDHIVWYLDEIPKPPRDWDGSETTLGYPMPEKGTKLYKYLLCWPHIANNVLGATNPSEWNIKYDLDRKKCFKDGWMTEYGRALMHLSLPGGFPHKYQQISNQEGVKYTITIESSPEYQDRPPQDWDGRKETLGFPVPQKGTTHYNMLLCWPYDIRQN